MPVLVDRREDWVKIANVCLAVAVVSLVLNISLPWELSGQMQTYSFIRKTISKVFSSGTLWAAVPVCAGWQMGRPRAAAVAGLAAAEGTLLVHYVLGMTLGIYDSTELSSNVTWFLAAAIVGGPLGLCGWIASRPGWAGVAGRLLVPLGAVLEPFATGRFNHPFPQIPWPERYSDTASAVLLMTLGALLTAVVLQRGPNRLVHPLAR